MVSLEAEFACGFWYFGNCNKGAAVADFEGFNAIGRISGWVSGLFDFEVVRVSDGEGIFWRHVEAESMEALEQAYLDFLETIRRSTRIRS